MPTIKLNGVSLYIVNEGEGFPFILLHGLGSSHLYWESEIKILKEYYRMIAPDSRGHGKSEKIKNYTLQDHINDIIALMDELNIPSCYLMGISAGSYIAQGVAIAIPERVKKLILVAPKPNGLVSSTELFFDKHNEQLKGCTEEEKQVYLHQHIFHDYEAIVKSAVFSGQDQLSSTQLEEANKALMGFDFRQNLPRVKAETLVISGRYDGLNSSDAGRECAFFIPNATFVEMEKSGHGPNIEEPELFMKLVINFLTG